VAYRTIMVGTDGSNTATRARTAATRLAQRLGAQLQIVTAFGANLDQEAATAVLRDAREAVRSVGVETKTHLQKGSPDEVLTAMADREGADLIVVGNVGMGKASRFRLGGIAEQVAHGAPCDVLIVHTREDRPEAGSYRNVLAGTDGSATASEAARKAFELAEILGAAVTLVHVGDPLLGAIVLERTAKDRPGSASVRTEALEEGDPADRIIEVAGRGEVDLVLVGNKGLAGARRYLLGSIPSKVAHGSPVDVLIAKTVGRTIDDLVPGHGGLVDVDGRRLAVYKAEDGSLIALSPRCQHMGCTVDWNDADRSWDCPCHGSRYKFDGTVFQGPANRDLDKEGIR
jgi:nucleotide-binding universal stress UspA family protein/nitrite reductase/ring-hydroxylating ferredoxin subunit